MHIATLMLLGSGELGKEFAIAAKRLGCRVVACDRYADAPAMQVADACEVFSMLDGDALREPDHGDGADAPPRDLSRRAEARRPDRRRARNLPRWRRPVPLVSRERRLTFVP